jgi:hypothetical protein
MASMKNGVCLSGWQNSKADIFWGEIAPCDHVVQIYEDDAIFIDVLSGFVGSGINTGDSIIIIATEAHIQALEARLRDFAIDVAALIANGQYFPLNAEQTLDRFMVKGWPDEKLFMELITELFTKAKKANRNIRAFGEMVAILWAQGHNGATVHLEHLWNKVSELESFCLFCAYPKSGFTEDINVSIRNICGAHSRIITAKDRALTELAYASLLPDNHN